MSHQPANIFAGTQVLSLVEIRGPNNSLVHPRGVVAVVTRMPAGTKTHYLVRFPDGFEKSLEASQLEVLKHFKDRLGICRGAVPAPSGNSTVADRRYSDSPTLPAFDLEQFVVFWSESQTGYPNHVEGRKAKNEF